jgi:hypothetical protein
MESLRKQKKNLPEENGKGSTFLFPFEAKVH